MNIQEEQEDITILLEVKDEKVTTSKGKNDHYMIKDGIYRAFQGRQRKRNLQLPEINALEIY